jgi:hypothetical protein
VSRTSNIIVTYSEDVPPSVSWTVLYERCNVHHSHTWNVPSNKNAIGQPMATFCRVRAVQKILSKFQMKKPKANSPVPVAKVVAIDDFTSFGMRLDRRRR